jgi:hypothetical protein
MLLHHLSKWAKSVEQQLKCNAMGILGFAVGLAKLRQLQCDQGGTAMGLVQPQHTATGAAATSSTHHAAAEAFSNTMHNVSSMVTDHTALLSEAVEHG